jgi:hypothetical protein
MEKPPFVLVQKWLLDNAGFNLEVLALAIAMSISIWLYTQTAIVWLHDHATNPVKLNVNNSLTKNLRATYANNYLCPNLLSARA